MDPKRSLSEISHLFLSEIRERQSGGGARPKRIPPGKRVDVSVDMTPEEFAASLEADASEFSEGGSSIENYPHPSSQSAAIPPAAAHSAAQVSVVLSSHLVDHPHQRVRQYARHLAGLVGRVGLIEVDAADIHVSCFELHGGEAAMPAVIDELDGRRISETLAELSFDVNRWLICLPNPRTAEARDLLRVAPHWVLLSTADHEGVVSTYRALKGLAELGQPHMSLVVLNARDEAQADAVFRKLDAVSGQFLGCHVEAEAPVRAVQDVTEHFLLHCRATRDKGQLASGPQWQIMGTFLANAIAPRREEIGGREINEPEINKPAIKGTRMSAGEMQHDEIGRDEILGQEEPAIEDESPLMDEPFVDAPSPRKFSEPKDDIQMNATIGSMPRPVSPVIPTASHMAISTDAIPEVIELRGDVSDRAVLEAVVMQGGVDGRWVQCPIKPPMCPQSVLAVDRDHRLVLLANAGKGLTEFHLIGSALRWMSENGELIRMALPQLAIDASATPMVRLLVDHGDLSASVLQPLIQSATVSVQTYRRLKWGQKTGLLLEAA